MDKNELMHFGKAGMKWGHKKASTIQTNTPAHTAAKKKIVDFSAKAKDGTPVNKMSDTELRNRINRLQMEKQYAQLTQKEKSKGQQMIKDIFVNAAKQTATSYVQRYMSKGVESALNFKIPPRPLTSRPSNGFV